jgi:hypothetical protein
MIILVPIRKESFPVFTKGLRRFAVVYRWKTVVANMAFSRSEQPFCVLEYARTSSVVTVQRRFRAKQMLHNVSVRLGQSPTYL